VCRSSGPPGASALDRALDRADDRARVGRRAFESSIARAREETRATSRVATTPRGTDSIEFLIFERDERLARERRGR